MEDTLISAIITMPSYEEFLESARKSNKFKSIDELIRSLKENISNFERKYQMTSKDFVNRFERGEFEGVDNYPDFDLFKWWSDYKSFKKLIEKKEA